MLVDDSALNGDSKAALSKSVEGSEGSIKEGIFPIRSVSSPKNSASDDEFLGDEFPSVHHIAFFVFSQRNERLWVGKVPNKQVWQFIG